MVVKPHHRWQSARGKASSDAWDRIFGQKPAIEAGVVVELPPSDAVESAKAYKAAYDGIDWGRK